MGAELDQRMSRFFSDEVCIPNKAGFGVAIALCRSAPPESLSGKGLGSHETLISLWVMGE